MLKNAQTHLLFSVLSRRGSRTLELITAAKPERGFVQIAVGTAQLNPDSSTIQSEWYTCGQSGSHQPPASCELHIDGHPLGEPFGSLAIAPST